MRLKEFAVTCPYIKHENQILNTMNQYGVSRSEAIKIDYRNNHREYVVLLRDRTRCIASMIERYYKPITTDKYWKILVNLLKEEDSSFRENSSGGVLEAYCVYNYKTLLELSDYEFKKVTLELIEKTVLQAMREHNWDTESFVYACDQVRLNDYQNKWVWKKKKNKSSIVGEVFIEHEVKSVKIFMRVKSKSGEIIKEQQLIEDMPNEFVYAPYLGEIEWISDNCVALITKKGELYKTEF